MVWYFKQILTRGTTSWEHFGIICYECRIRILEWPGAADLQLSVVSDSQWSPLGNSGIV